MLPWSCPTVRSNKQNLLFFVRKQSFFNLFWIWFTFSSPLHAGVIFLCGIVMHSQLLIAIIQFKNALPSASYHKCQILGHIFTPAVFWSAFNRRGTYRAVIFWNFNTFRRMDCTLLSLNPISLQISSTVNRRSSLIRLHAARMLSWSVMNASSFTPHLRPPMNALCGVITCIFDSVSCSICSRIIFQNLSQFNIFVD